MSHQEIVETRGQYRAVIEIEEGPPGRPDGDFFGTVIWLDDQTGKHTEVFAHAFQQERAAEGFAESLSHAWQHYRDMELVERYMRMFHGVVGFDYLDRPDSKFVNIVTRADLEIWGWDPDDPSSWPKHDDGTTYHPQEGNLKETEAWADGDVWGVRVEKNVTWSTDDEDYDDHDSWELVPDTDVWGYFGEDNARDAVTWALDHFAPRPCRKCGRPLKLDDTQPAPYPWIHAEGAIAAEVESTTNLLADGPITEADFAATEVEVRAELDHEPDASVL